MLRTALARAGSSGLRVFLARPAAGERELPYSGLGDLLAFVSEDLLVGLADPQRAAIEASVRRKRSAKEVDRHALSRGLLELLRLEGGSGDLLLAIDDLQWLDRPTASALTFALRRIDAVPIRVIVATRTDDGMLADLPLGLAGWHQAQRLVIGPLTATELGAVLRERLGQQLPRPRLEALCAESGGNPMFALELARAGIDGRRAAGGLTLALSERLRAVDPGARAPLSFAAAALRPSTDLLLRAGIERVEVKAALATGMLETDGERLSFPQLPQPEDRSVYGVHRMGRAGLRTSDLGIKKSFMHFRPLFVVVGKRRLQSRLGGCDRRLLSVA